MIQNEGTSSYKIAVVERTLKLLEALSDASDPRGVTELARSIGATKSATFRILMTLEDQGYVMQDRESGKYRLGMQLIQLGQKSLESIDLRTVARPIIEDLHNQFNETINLGVLDNDRISYVDIIESHHGLRMAAKVGAHDLVHSTALGKAILAFSPGRLVDEYLAGPLESRTERTLTNPDDLREELRKIRRSGFSRDRGENEDGAACFGAPIFDHRGEVIAAISVSGPANRLAGEKAEDVAVAVRAGAQSITIRFGGRQPSSSTEGSGDSRQVAV